MTRLNEVLDYKSKYTYDNGVLINKFNIKEQEELDQIERLITTVKLSKLYKKYNNISTDKKFDAEYYYSIHKYLFSDIYDFAGKVRGENIQKTISFCPPQYIHQTLIDTLNRAERDIYKIENEEDLVTFIAEYYADLDVIHPFREGNGRTLREFLRQYVLKINDIIDFGKYEIDYNRITDKDGYIKAVIIADSTCNIEPLKEYFRPCLINKMEKHHVR